MHSAAVKFLRDKILQHCVTFEYHVKTAQLTWPANNVVLAGKPTTSNRNSRYVVTSVYIVHVETDNILGRTWQIM